MTVENLHDAIGQLPSDLIVKVDEKRCRKPKVIPFSRYAAIAACLALILGSSIFLTRTASGGAKETAAEAPAAIMQAPKAMNGAGADAAFPEEEAAPKEQDAFSPDAPAEDRSAGTETYAAGEISPEGVTEEVWEGYPEFPAEDVQYAETRNIGTACGTSDPVIRVLRSPAELEAQRQEFGYCDLEAFDVCAERYTGEWFETHDLLVVLVKELPKDGTFSLASVTESNGSWCIRFYSGGPYAGETIDRFVLAALEKGQIPEESHLFAMFEVP